MCGVGMLLHKCICSMVGHNQTGFVPSQDICTNMAEVHLAAKLGWCLGKSNTILLLDFEKAYDRVDQTFLYIMMCNLGFGLGFVWAIVVLHTGFIIVGHVNRFLLEIIEVSSGVCQGCPIAPLLFALVIKPFYAALELRLFF